MKRGKYSRSNGPDETKANNGAVSEPLELGAKGRAQYMSIVIVRGTAA
jgi:hypothetical protein